MQQTTTTPAPQAAKPKPRNPVPPAELQEGAIAKMDAAGLIAILKNAGSSEFQKAKACMRIGELAAKEAVPTLAALLGDEKMNTYARYGLEPIADPSVDDALRAALPKLKGNLQIGVINSINKRRDAKALPALMKLMQSPDANVARAAVAAIGSIGTAESAKALQSALPKSTGLMKMAVADAGLVCAERMLAAGQRDQGLAFYAFLSGPDVPRAARQAAMSGIIHEERALTRPR